MRQLSRADHDFGWLGGVNPTVGDDHESLPEWPLS